MARPKKEISEKVRYWLEEIAETRKREKDYRKQGQDVIDIYGGDRKDEIPFNILFSNTETLLPALYSQSPRPVVEPKHKNKKDPLANASAHAGQRMLEYLIDNNMEGYETYSESMGAATLDALLPGRGVTAIKYDSADDVSWEIVCTESKKWDRVYFGYATKWEDVPWIAYELFIDEDEAERLFGAKSKKLRFTEGEETDDEEDESRVEKHQGNRRTACVYQIWDKSDRTVKYISHAYPDGYLTEEEDPLGLIGFFNCPKPLQFILKPGSMVPKALYALYENQALELNRITRRLNRVIEAIKIRGVYDASLGDELEHIMDQDDNGLVPTEKGAMMSDGSFDKAIWIMPVEKLVSTAATLYQAREQCKQVIYEITGISDVIRGSSKASETLGAQKIKEGWGSMRLKRMQRAVQEYSRSTMRIMLDIAVQKLNVESWQKMTGMDFPTNEQKQQAQTFIQNVQMQAQQIQMQSQGQPQPPPPQIQQQMQQAQAILAKPSWEDILDLLKSDMERSFRIDIETNSTLDVEATEDKQMISEFMNAFAQLMNGVAPMVKEGIMPFGALKSMLLEISQRFRFGRNVEEEINAMQPPKQPNVEAMQKQMQDAQKQLQQAQQQVQQEKQALEEQKKVFEQNVQKKSMEFIEKENGLEKMQMKMQYESQPEQNNEIVKMQVEAQTKKEIAEMQARFDQETALQKASIEAATKVRIAQIQASATMEQVEEEKEPEEDKTLLAIAEAIKSMSAPKKVIRDQNGRVVGMEIDIGLTN